ncbi:CdaR family protein [Clostridium sp.]|uniref:CdaR family protein n=1 Tax=Clostridium sp. TaxID=1506 RepID=UPI003D6C9691
MDKDGKQQFIIKICCVIAAFALWLFITSTENPVTAFKIKGIPVQLVNSDILTRSDLVLVPGQDLTTSLNIKGANTSMLLNAKAEDFTVVVDLSQYALKKGEQKIPIQIRKSPDNISVLNSDSLFININLDERIEAKLPIDVNVSGKPKEGFYASTAKLSQESATVVGGSNFVNVVKELLVEVNIDGQESDLVKSYKLKPVDAAGKEVKEVTVNPSNMNVNIPIRKTKSVGVKVKTIGNLPNDFTLSSISVLPEQLDVTGNTTELDQLENLNTEAIDLSKISKTTTMSARVVIPDGLSLVNNTTDGIVKVKITLNKVVQKNLSLDIKYVNLDEKYDAKLEKVKQELVISGTEALIDSLDLKKFSASVDLANLVEGEHTVKVSVPMPEGINLISGVPDKILVTITKKQTGVTTSNGN